MRDAATTMGLLFAGMGVGAFLGPLLFNLAHRRCEPLLPISASANQVSMCVRGAGAILGLLPLKNLYAIAAGLYATPEL